MYRAQGFEFTVASKKLAVLFYVMALALTLSWRPNLDVGVLLTPTYLFVLVLLPLLFIRSNVYFYKFDYLLLLFYFYALVTSFYAPDPAASVRFFFGIVFFWGIYLCFKLSLYKMGVDRALNAFSKLGKCYLLFSLFFYIGGFVEYSSWQEHQIYHGLMVERQLPRLVSLCFDPNMAAMTFVPFVYFFLLCRRSYLWLFMGLLLLLATLSRGAMVSTLLGLLWLAFIKPSKSNMSKVAVFLSLVFFSLMLLIHMDFIPFSYIEQRMEGFLNGSGRMDIWINAFSIFVERPLLGWGGFSFRDVNQLYFDDPRFAHNTFIEVLVETGVLGFLVFFTFIVLAIKHSVSLAKDPRLLFIVPATVSCVISMLFLSVYINQILVFYLSLLNIGGPIRAISWQK